MRKEKNKWGLSRDHMTDEEEEAERREKRAGRRGDKKREDRRIGLILSS